MVLHGYMRKEIYLYIEARDCSGDQIILFRRQFRTKIPIHYDKNGEIVCSDF